MSVLLRSVFRGMEFEELNQAVRRGVFHALDGLVLPLVLLVAAPQFISGLGVEQYGTWMLLNGLVELGAILFSPLNEATTRFTSRYLASGDRQGTTQVIRIMLSLYSVTALFCAAVFLIVAPSLAGNPSSSNNDPGATGPVAAIFCIFSVILCLRFMDNFFHSVLHGMESFELSAKVGMTGCIATISLQIALLKAGYELTQLMMVSASVLFVSIAAKAIILARCIGFRLLYKRCPRPGILSDILHFCFYNWFRSGMGAANVRIEGIIVGVYLNTSALAYYSFCHQIASQGSAFLSRLFYFLLPYSGRIDVVHDKSKFKRMYVHCTVFVCILSGSMYTILYFVGPVFLQMYFSPDFCLHAVPVLKILCVRYAITSTGIVNHLYMLGIGLVKMQTIITSLLAFINIAGICLLTPIWGLTGAAAGPLLGIPVIMAARCYIPFRIFGSGKPAGQALASSI